MGTLFFATTEMEIGRCWRWGMLFSTERYSKCTKQYYSDRPGSLQENKFVLINNFTTFVSINNSIEIMAKYEEHPYLVTVYFGKGITFLEAGDKLSNGVIVDSPTAEVQYINGIMSAEYPETATLWGEQLCNEMGAYIIPQLYTGEIIGLEEAIQNYNERTKLKPVKPIKTQPQIQHE